MRWNRQSFAGYATDLEPAHIARDLRSICCSRGILDPTSRQIEDEGRAIVRAIVPAWDPRTRPLTPDEAVRVGARFRDVLALAAVAGKQREAVELRPRPPSSVPA